jgi:hypothetical protein
MNAHVYITCGKNDHYYQGISTLCFFSIRIGYPKTHISGEKKPKQLNDNIHE